MSYRPKPVGSPLDIFLGKTDFYLRPKLKRKQGGAFNGQDYRRKIFKDLLNAIGFSTVVETGTFRGVTTHYMHSVSGLPVYSAEVNPRFFGYATTLLRQCKSVHLYNMDSRAFLRHIIDTVNFGDKGTLFYLDAHWAEDLPLLEEMQIIFEKFPSAIVMVDDFKVPWDAQYGYDDYGDGKSLSLEYLEPALLTYQLTAFFPALGAEKETGVRRGCVVLAKTNENIRRLGGIDSLRMFKNSD